MDALVKALEACGCRVEICKGYSRTTRVSVGGETVAISIRERSARSERIPPTGQKVSTSSWQRWELTPSGELAFTVDVTHADGVRKTWKDGQRRLEDQLDDAVQGLLRAAEAGRLGRLQFEEAIERRRQAERERAELERLRAEEAAPRKALEEAADSWVRSRELTAFLNNYEATLPRTHAAPDRETPEREWLAWARRHAEHLDSIRSGTIDRLVLDYISRQL